MILEVAKGADVGRTGIIRGDQFTLGREGSSNLVLRDPKASRRHASVRELPDGRAELTDLGSRNGTFVNGQQVVGSVVLRGGEELRIGDTLLRAIAEQASAPPPPPIAPLFQAPPPAQQPVYPVVTQSAAPPPPGPSASTMQRLVIQRGLRRVTIIGIAVLVLLAIVIGGLVTGVFEGSGHSGSSQLSNAQVVNMSRPRTVLVVTNNGSGTGGRGSGWVWDASQGLIVTNAHVVAGGQDYTVSTGDKLTVSVGNDIKIDGATARNATLKGEADCEDIAVLKVDDTRGLQTMPRVPSKKVLQVGDDVVVIGYPATLNLSQDQPRQDANLTGNAGVISTVSTTFPAIPGGSGEPTVGPYKDAILTDAVINQGNSGGPLVNHQARLVGMNSAQRTDVQGQFYAVGIDRINEIVPRLLNGDHVC
jgi:S1-C subfamily serine protease